MSDYPPPAGQPTPPGPGGSSPYGAAGSPPPPPPPPPPSYGPGYGPGYVSEPSTGYQAGWGAPPPGPLTGTGGFQPPQVGQRPGELLDRFVARLIDHVLLGIVNAILVTAFVIGVFFNADAGLIGYGDSIAAAAVGSVLSVLIGLGYFVYMETQRGTTLGKMVMKLRVDSETGGRPTVEQSVKRNIWMALPLLGIVPVVGGFVGGLAQLVAVVMIAVGINNDTLRRRPWTDTFAGTQVVKEG